MVSLCSVRSVILFSVVAEGHPGREGSDGAEGATLGRQPPGSRGQDERTRRPRHQAVLRRDGTQCQR